jgi:hypothetical protein
MSADEAVRVDRELKLSENNLQRYKMGLPEETSLQVALRDIGDLKAKLESSLSTAKDAIESINDKLPSLEKEYLGRVELAEVSKRLVDSMEKFSDLERIESQLNEAVVDVGTQSSTNLREAITNMDTAFHQLDYSIKQLNGIMQANVDVQDKMRQREKDTLDAIDVYLRKYS